MAHPQLPSPEPKKFSDSISRYVRIGTIAMLILVFGFGGWAAIAKLSSAVIASGKVVVESNVKRVQHPDGGIIGSIMVRDGETVQAGDLLVRLDETLVAANRALLDGQIVALEARLARLEAEQQDKKSVDVPDELKDRTEEPLVKQALQSERTVFEARQETLRGQVERLSERINQLREQIAGLEAQRDAKAGEIELIDEELEVLEGLFERGRTTRDRIVNLKRNRLRLEGERGSFVSQIAMAKGRISETELEILQLRTDQREQTFQEITEIKPELANLKERRVAADFQLKRMDIRAPADGVVFEMAVHNIDGVVQPGETIMQIVPHADQLVIEARLSPTDVDQVAVGQEASIVLSAFDMDQAPQLHGEVIFVSAEASVDEQSGLTYYVVRLTLKDGELERLPEELELLPGMPAEVYIATGGQTVVAYLMRPLTDQIRKAWRET